jgi:hypothetical protein
LIGILFLWGFGYGALNAQPLLPNHLDRLDDITRPQVHVVYLIPSDMIDEGIDRDGRIETSIAAFQLWMARVTEGYWLQLDTYQGRLDISVLKVPQTVDEIDTTDLLWSLDGLLREAGLKDPQKAYLIYYAGTGVIDRGCSQADRDLRIAAIYLNGTFSEGDAPCYTYPFTASVTEPGFLEMWTGEAMLTLDTTQCFSPANEWLSFDSLDCSGFNLSAFVDTVGLPYQTLCPPPLSMNQNTLTFVNTGEQAVRVSLFDSFCTELEPIRVEAGESWLTFGVRMSRWRAYTDNGQYIGDFTYDDRITPRRQFSIADDFKPLSLPPQPPICSQGDVASDRLFTIHNVLSRQIRASRVMPSCREVPQFTLTQSGWSAWYGGYGEEWRFRDALTGDLLETALIFEPFEVRIDGR